MTFSDNHSAGGFLFERDTFAFANELVWHYRMDPATGRMATTRSDPPPTYSHRCFVMVRSARQFFYHTRCVPSLPRLNDAETLRLIRRVVRRSPRFPSRDPDRIVIPGHHSLREFSETRAGLLKAACGGAWQSYCLRSHWRMVFPISRRHQECTAQKLTLAPPNRIDPIVHLVRFPQLTINHGITLFGREETSSGVRFTAYDPNQPAAPTELIYDRANRTFHFPANHYWAGGPLDVIEVYRGLLY